MGLEWRSDHEAASLATDTWSLMRPRDESSPPERRPTESPPKPDLYPTPSAGPQWYTVFGGPFEGVHQIFDVSSELLPLLVTSDSPAYGPSEGIDSRARAECSESSRLGVSA